jgi:hypothetical protein
MTVVRTASFASFVGIALLGACTMSTSQDQGTTPAPQQQPPPQASSQPVMQPQPSAQPVMQPQPTATATGASSGAVPSTSNFGTVALNPGFVPDPHVVTGQSGGQDRAQSRHGSCRGWIARNPDHLFDATGNFGNLRIIGASQSDVTLVVLRPDGTYMCDDDTEGRNPIVGGSFPAGRYAVWVGSYREGEVAPYRLGFTELGSVTASQVAGGGGGGGQNLASNFGTVTLTPGFTPDPHVASGVSGGQIDARQVGNNCRGWISQTPDHIFQATRAFNGLRVMARSNSDTTLVMADSSGRVWCNDDAEGRNPVIQGSFAAGAYRVWVGSYQQGENARYSLGFTELDSVRTNSLPAP